MVVVHYINEYDVTLAGFNFEALADDYWMAQMLNEAQMILVVSWSDLATRIVFSLGLALTTANMKDLLCRSPMHKLHIKPDIEVLFTTRLSTAGMHNIKYITQICKKRAITLENTRGYIKTYSRLMRTIHLAFAVWGAVVIALYVHANLKASVSGCIPKVHPMAGILPSCFIVNFNCYGMNISGTKDESYRHWEKFDRTAVVKLRILHCHKFDMPATFQDFHLVEDIRVYNSTINTWAEDAAITNIHHSRLTTLSVIRTNMTNGMLPVGFQSSNFSSSLLDICFCETNLQEIPDDIDSKWHAGSSVYLENSKLTSVPPALVRLQLYYLVLAGNPISEVPPELFENTGMLYLILGRTNISSLPRTVPYPTISPPFIDVTDTAISFFWSWIDPLAESMLELGSPMILASGSTYCSDLEKIMAGQSSNFSASFQTDFSPLLMDPSEQNWGLLLQTVDCSPPLYSTAFPLAVWDNLYRLGQ
ncbi:unnamed protein product [Phytophthora fragariaefolia]|uniref:Unnamed protein product n=1 Tax=Phytophthora fragariaefolia TaxID=1490495 RepID=A0A9W6XUX1_9STRA|nr:unnamed protein product [Phytophthora fragariaefolia]